MTKRYKALKPVGPWSKGDTIGDLPQVQIDQTIKRKGSSKPLIDTGQLRQSITYRVVD